MSSQNDMRKIVYNNQSLSSPSEPLKVASLFCGCGGSDLGMMGGFDYLERHYPRLNFDIVFAVDFDAKAVETYNANFIHPAICKDIAEVDFTEIGDVDVMIGGFPCQSFSTVNPTKDTNDARANLYKQIVRFLETKQPKYFICENVKGLLTLQGGAIIRKIAREFEETGYVVQFKLLKAVEFGVPQRRERVIIVGIRKDLGIQYRFPFRENSETNAVPLSRVIDELDIPEKKYYFSEKAVQGMKNAKNNMKRGLWQDLSGPCLTITSHLAKTSINSRDPVLLVNPATELYRRFTPREAARIQSFPDNFSFPVSDSYAYRQIGNAVPPVFMWHIANSLIKCIERPVSQENWVDDSDDLFLNVPSEAWVQLTLFEPETLYLSKINNGFLLIGSCRQGIIDWIKTAHKYAYPVTEEELSAHPELKSVKFIMVRHKSTVVGHYEVTSVETVMKPELNLYDYPMRSSRHKADTMYLLFDLKQATVPTFGLDVSKWVPILGKGVGSL